MISILALRVFNLLIVFAPIIAHLIWQGDFSVVFAYLFLLLFGQTDNIYKVEQDFMDFFLEGKFRSVYLSEINFTLSSVVSEI